VPQFSARSGSINTSKNLIKNIEINADKDYTISLSAKTGPGRYDSVPAGNKKAKCFMGAASR
jgi:hypothetical protein